MEYTVGYIQKKVLLKRYVSYDRKIYFCFNYVRTPFYITVFSHCT